MWRYSKKEKDLEEIFLHIQDIIEERNLDNELKQIEILQENLKKTAGELDINNYSKDDIFEVVEDDETVIIKDDEKPNNTVPKAPKRRNRKKKSEDPSTVPLAPDVD